MMWPFPSRANDKLIWDLRQRLDQAEDAYTDIVQAKSAAESAMREMQKATTDDGVADIARDVAAQVADIYASGRGGVKQRDIAVHAVVAEAIRKAVRGEAHWNEGRLAAMAQEPADA